jgi:hypothetical protein
MQARRAELDAAKLRTDIPCLWQALALPGEPRRVCRSPFREDRTPSFSIYADGHLWKDFATGEGGDAVAFVQRATGCTVGEAIRRVLDLAGGVSSPVTLAPRAAATARPAPVRYDGLAGLDVRPPTLGEVIALADLRRWPFFAGLEIACGRGLLCMADVPHRGATHRAWLLADANRKSAQARRLDGMEWQGDGETFKSKTLRADSAHPPGLADIVAAARPAVLICEGEPDTLAGLSFAWLAGVADRVGVLCLTGASKTLPPGVLDKLRGRRCRVLRQADRAGHRCGLAWAEALAAAGIACDLVNLDRMARADGLTAKDAADLLRRPADLDTLEPLAAALLRGLTK